MPAFEYQCPNEHVSTHICPVAYRPKVMKCAACGKRARRIMSLPVLHTLGTFSATIADEAVQRTRDPGDGSYFDPNLGFDRKTGKHTRITSPAHRDKLLKEAGLYERGPTDQGREVERDRKRKPKSFSWRNK